jgi:hypothetical protein
MHVSLGHQEDHTVYLVVTGLEVPTTGFKGSISTPTSPQMGSNEGQQQAQ